MNDLIRFLKKNKNFLICMHIDPDGDTIGSSCALSLVLKKLKKKIKIYSNDLIPQKYHFLKCTDSIVSSIDKDEKFDAIIALDCSDKKRISTGVEIEKHTDIIINIDHHLDNSLFGKINYVKKASSTGELIYKLAKKLKIKIDSNIADAIYTAIITDTGNFRYDNTTKEVFQIASDLVSCGISPYDIALKIYETRTPNEIKILGKSLERIEYFLDGCVAYVSLSYEVIKETGATTDEMTSIVDFIRSIKSVDIAILIREIKKDVIKVNFRSKIKNVQIIAKSLGGGGHPKAAGALLNEPLNLAKEKILTTVEKLWTAS